jgi:lysophospholipase L1-like esterase
MDKLRDSSDFAVTYVLIQFAHNDQPGKAERSTDLKTEFPENIRRYVKEVKAAGAKPVLITPLTRRIFKDGKLNNDLVPWADAIKKVAAEESVPVIDLNAKSAAAVQRMGPEEANTLAMAPPPPDIAASAASGTSMSAPKPPPEPARVERTTPPAPVFDYTHLGDKGSKFFGRMVADELASVVPELKPYIRL